VAKDVDFITQLVALSYDPFFVIDRERRITHHNDLFALMLGLRSAQRRKLQATPFHEMLKLDDTGRSCITDCLTMDRNIRVQGVMAKGPDGRDLVLDLSALPLRDKEGRVTGVIVLHRDVTDEHRLKERYTHEKQAHLHERESLLRIIGDRDADIKKLKRQLSRK